MRNGNGIGFRNLPNISEASGVWDVEDAYLADRDGVWPRWPTDAGLPIVPGLAVWLEVDYGLYQDRAATIPAVADGDPVNAWVNRGYAGALKISNGFAPMILRISSSHRWLETTGAFSDPMHMTARRYTYIFGLGYDPVSNNGYVFSKCDPDSGVFSAEQPRFHAQHASTISPTSGSSSQSLSRSVTSTRFFCQGMVDFSYLSENVEHFGFVNAGRVMRAGTSGPLHLSGGTTAVPQAQSTPISVRFFGIDTGSGLTNNAPSKVKAVIIYLSDTPLSPAQMESVANTLAVKYDAYLYKAANWGN